MNALITLALLLLMATSTFAAGDVKINGDLEFPDGTIQSTATVQGPQGEKGDTGPAGPQGAPGTTNGITKAVHGLFGPSGVITPGNGFSVKHTGTGAYTVTFTTPFNTAPHCLLTSLGHQQTSTGYADCELSALSTTSSINITCFKYIPGNGSYSEQPSDNALTFICIE